MSKVNELKVGTNNFTTFTPEHLYKNTEKLRAVNPSSCYSNPDFGKMTEPDRADWIEQYTKRTATSRTFKGDGDVEIYQYAQSPINYLDRNGNYVAINPRLSVSSNGWSAPHQEFPTFLNTDGSTEITLASEASDHLKFNQHNLINGQEIDLTNFTVGDDGMLIHNAGSGIDKRILFSENRIETDYILNSPLAIPNDLIISEEISLPAGYSLKEKNLNEIFGDQQNANEYIVADKYGKECAHLKVPVCYDSRQPTLSNNSNVASLLSPLGEGSASLCFGKYNLRKENGRLFLEIIIPASWLNDPARIYPVTVDPLVTGPTSTWSGGTIPSCLTPNFQSATIPVTIPAGITMTNFYVTSSFYADPLAPAVMGIGEMYFTTGCGRNPSSTSLYWTVPAPNNNKSGTGYLLQQDMASTLGCCMSNPSCTAQTFALNMFLGRISGGSGCNAIYIYYSPTTSWPFQAYVVGRSVEGSWLITPTSACANQCAFTVNATGNYGVPPYTISHPWATSSITFGSHTSGTCSSTGTASITLTNPLCPVICGNTTSVVVPPPTITDACGNTVSGLSSKTVTINRVPDVTATPSSLSVCSGTAINIALNSCVAGSSITWSGSNGSTGSGNISGTLTNASANPITINYTVNVSSGGCAGSPIIVPITVNPLPTITVASSAPSICFGQSATFSASGGATYSWSPATGLSSTSGGIVTANPTANTIYTISSTDANGCTGSATVALMVNPLPVITVSPSAIICNGLSTQLSASGGTTYNWSPSTGISNTNISNPSANPTATTTYTVIVTNANNCVNAATTTVTVNPLPTVPVSAPTSICLGSNTQLSAAGGTTYSWTPASGLSNTTIANPIASPMVATSYTVVVIDANGCLNTATTTISIIPLLNVIVSASASICSGASTQITSSGGSIYAWTPSFGLSNSTISNPVANPLVTSTYSVNVTDANGCTGSASITITVNPLPNISVSPNASICNGLSIQLSASGGTTYNWSPSTGISNIGISNPFANPTATTTYTVIVTDANNCVNAANTTVTVNPLPTVAVSAPSSICPGSNTQLSAGGGTTFSWTPATGLSNTTIANPIASPMVATSYTVVVMDANGCLNVATTTVSINPLLNVSVSPSISICIGASTQITSSGGSIYAWTPSFGLSNSTISNPVANPLATSTYTVNVTDANGCTGSASVTITVNPLPNIFVSPNASICNGLSTQLSASGGTTYNWSPSTGISNTTVSNPSANPTATTTYTVMVTDANNCVNTSTITVSVNPLPTVTVSAPSSICPGSNTQLSAGGGTTYSWTPASGLSNTTIANPIASPMVATSYTVVVMDANGCLNVATTTVSINPLLNVSVSPSISICIGASTQITSSGGTIYAWTPSTGLSNPTISNPVANPSATSTYSVNVADANGCTGSASVTINVNPLPSVVVSNASFCVGGNVQLSASGGSGYSWFPSSGLNNANIANPVATPAATSVYTVIATDINGCMNSNSATVSVYQLPVVTVSPNTSICSGSIQQLTSSGGTIYSWTPTFGLSNPFISSPLAQPSTTTTYTINVTDINGCNANETITITVLPSTIAKVSPGTEICDGHSTQLSASGGVVYSWSPTVGLDNAGIPNPLARPEKTTTYKVLVSSPGSTCPPAEDSVTVTVHPLPTLAIIPDTTILSGTAITLATNNGGANYQWSPSTGLSCASCWDPLASPARTTTYKVTAVDVHGCTAGDSVRITVEDILTLYIPSAFIPFSNTKNNLFQAYGIGVEDFELYVFDRWGTVIFETRDIRTGWDGTYKGQPVQQDVYVYLARAQSLSGKSISKTGSVTVITGAK